MSEFPTRRKENSQDGHEIHNNLAWYNFVYLFGLACFFDGGGNWAAATGRRGGSKSD